MPTYSLPGGAANYSASWKAYLKPAPAGGEYTITAVCTGCGVSVERSTATIHRATYGDVYFCSGSRHLRQSSCGFLSISMRKRAMQKRPHSKSRTGPIDQLNCCW